MYNIFSYNTFQLMILKSLCKLLIKMLKNSSIKFHNQYKLIVPCSCPMEIVMTHLVTLALPISCYIITRSEIAAL